MTSPESARPQPLAGTELHLVNRTYWPAVGGVERQLSCLEALAGEMGATVVVWTSTGRDTDRAHSGPEGGNVRRRSSPVWAGGSTRRFMVWVALGLIFYRLRHPRRPMVLVAGRASAETAATLLTRRLFGVGLITYLAGGDEHGSEFSTQRRAWLQRQMVRSVDVFVAHAPSYLDEVMAAGHQGVGVVAATIVPAAGPPCPSRLGGTGTVRALWCGRNHPIKGLDRLARLAAGAMPAAGIRLTVITDTPPELPADIELHIGCTNPRSHMADFDVLVLTSRYEGQPNVMAEAALEGVPTVALSVGGIPESVAALGHGVVLDTDCDDAEFTAAVARVAAAYRARQDQEPIRASALRLYGPEARAGWLRALQSARSAGARRGGVVRMIGALAGGRALASLLSVAWLIGAARTLGAATFGRLSLILAVGGVLDIVSDLGIPLTLTHRAAQRLTTRSSVRRALAVRLLADVLVVPILVLVYRLATHDNSAAPLVFGASIGASSVYSTYTAVLRGQGAVRLEAANEALSRVAMVMVGLPWLLLGGGLLAAVSTYALADVASAAVLPVAASRCIAWRGDDGVDPRPTRLRPTLGLAAASAVNVMYNKVDMWILGFLAGPVVVAAYAVATRIADLVMLPSRALNSVSLALSEGPGRSLGLRGLSARSLAMTAPLALAGIVSAPLLPVLLGAQYRSAVEPTRILLVSCLVTGVLLAVAPLMAVRRRKLFLGASGLALIANVALNLALVPQIGASGAALATLLSESLLIGTLAGVAGANPARRLLRVLLEQVDGRLAPQSGIKAEQELDDLHRAHPAGV